MNSQTSVRKAFLAAAILSSFGALGCHEPPIKCNVTQSGQTGGNFAARYFYEEGSKTGDGDCDQLANETLYFGTFFKENKDHTPDYHAVSVGLEPGQLLGLVQNASTAAGSLTKADATVAPNPDDKAYAFGRFVNWEPDGNDFCTVTKMDPARVRLPKIVPFQIPDPNDQTGMAPPVDMPGSDPVDVTYTFSNLKVYMSVQSQGRQVAADLLYKKDGCTAKYKVEAIFPATSCAVPVDPKDPMGAQKPSDEACQIDAFAEDVVECDKGSMMCVPKHGIPSLK